MRAAPVTWKIPEVSQEDQAAWLRREQRALAEAITEAQIPPPAPPGTSAGAGQGTLLLHLRPCGPAPYMELGNPAREGKGGNALRGGLNLLPDLVQGRSRSLGS